MGSGRSITINTVTRYLRHYNGGQMVKEYPIAVGKPSTPTPTGNYKIKNKLVNPGGVLGTRWMGLNIPGGNYGIHGTNNPASIGTAASLGCIRMHNRHVEELFSQVSIGTPVQITAGSSGGGSIKQQQTAPSSGGSNYTAKAGDTLWNIARKFNVSLEELIAANNISNPDIISPGQVIIIP